MSDPRIAIVGATGAVGGELLSILAERGFPLSDLRVYASARSEGAKLRFDGTPLTVHEATPNSFDGADIVFFAAGGDTSTTLAPEAVKRGAVVVDKSSAWRMDPNVPLVIPEVNGGELAENKRLIAGPNCTTAGLAVAGYPIHRRARVRRVRIASYQAVSGAGRQALLEYY